MRRGFTIVEIMIVISIVMVLVSLAIPQILRSRVIGNETAAIANLKTLNNATQQYCLDVKTYPNALTDLSDSNPPYVDRYLASGSKQSYTFVYELVNADHFTIRASSQNTGLLRGRYFYTDESGVIRFNTGAEAGPDDEIVK